MTSEVVKNFINENRERNAVSWSYIKSLKKHSGRNAMILFLSPIFFEFFTVFYAGNLLYITTAVCVYWILILLLIHERFVIDTSFKNLPFDFRHYLSNFPASFSYFKYGFFTMLVTGLILFLVYVRYTWYEGMATLILIVGLIEITLLWNPVLHSIRKGSIELESDAVISRLRLICNRLGLPEVTPRIAKAKELKIANAFCAGILRPIIYITDFLYENVSTDEAIALLIHELVHLKFHDNFKRVILLVSVFTAIQAFILISGLAYAGYIPIFAELVGVFPFAIIIGVFAIMFVIVPPSGTIWKGQELRADRLAARETGADDLSLGILKAHYLNLFPLEFANRADRVHPPVIVRIDKIQNA